MGQEAVEAGTQISMFEGTRFSMNEGAVASSTALMEEPLKLGTKVLIAGRGEIVKITHDKTKAKRVHVIEVTEITVAKAGPAAL